MILGIRPILGAGISGTAGMGLRGTTAGIMAGITVCMAGATGTAGHIVLGATIGAAPGVIAITGDMDTAMTGIVTTMEVWDMPVDVVRRA